MAFVTKRGKKYCLRYRYEDEFGQIREKRVSGFNSKEEAWAAAKDLEAKSSAGIDIHGDSVTCSELMERWFSARCSDLAATTLAKYSNGIDQLSKTFVSELTVKKLTTQRFGLLLEELKKNVSIRTALDYTEPLRLSLSWAIDEKMIPINPLANVHLPKVPKRQQRILSDSDVEELISVASGEARRTREFRIPLLLALYGGLRREECAGLTWDMIDFDRNRITVREVITMTPDGKEHWKDPKTDLSSRTISMPAFVMAELRTEYSKFLRRTNVHTLQHNPRHRVCVSSTGDPYSLKSYSHPVLRLIREINAQREKQNLPRMPEASFHDLRHTHAAMLIRRGIQPKIISERLGHVSIKITMDLYGYLMPGLQDVVADIFDQEHPVDENSTMCG